MGYRNISSSDCTQAVANNMHCSPFDDFRIAENVA